MPQSFKYNDTITNQAEIVKNAYSDPFRPLIPIDVGYTTYTCGEAHDRRNPNWKPFRHLWDFCERTGYDFFVARDIIFEWLGRRLVCECQMLRDDEKRRRMELERIFGVDFGEPGERGLGLV